jgi:hypothetical protein
VTRSRTSAKQAGTKFESLIVGHLQQHVDDRIERRRLSGSKDRGDVSGVRVRGARVVIECKNTARVDLGTWANEAEVARGHDDALLALIAHKRHGRGAAGEQWITCTVDDLIALITGVRPVSA